MKRTFLLSIFILFISASFAQLNKNHWFAGGTALFSQSKYTENINEVYANRATEITAYPDAGYFIINKLAVGIKSGISYSYGRSTMGSFTTKSKATIFTAGPLLRYYLLPASSKTNLLVEANYQFGSERNAQAPATNTDAGYRVSRASTSSYSFLAGPVFFITKNVGLEVLAGYMENKEESTTETTAFKIGAGIQVYL